MTMCDPAGRGLARLFLSIAVSALVGAGVEIGGMDPASAYEVWLTDTLAQNSL